MVRARVNGIDCILYYDERIPQEEAPPGYPHMYHLRHDEDDWSQPVNLEKFVLVNFFGTVFMKDPVEIDDSGYVEVESFWMEGKFVEFRASRSLLMKTFGLSE